MIRFHLTVVLALALFLCAPAALAQEGGAEKSDQPAGAVRVLAGHTFGADLEDDRGDVAVTRLMTDASYRFLSLRYAQDIYHWGDSADLPLGNGSDDPWDALHFLSLKAEGHDFFDRQWGWFANAALTSAFEKEMEDSVGASAGAGAIYNFSETVQAKAGVMAGVHPMGYSLLPVLGVDVNRMAETGWSAALGLPVTEVRYRWAGYTAEKGGWATRLGAAYDSGTYRLADDSDVERKGYLRTTSVVAGLYQDWRDGALSLSVGLEYRFLRSLDVYNDDGEHRNGYSVDAAPGIMANARWAF